MSEKQISKGKNIMLEDIIVDRYEKMGIDKSTDFFAYLAIVPYSNKSKPNMKVEGTRFYFGSGDSETEARDNLLDALIGNLIELKSTKRFPL